MATMTLKQVPEELYQRLKARAARHRRSLNAEAIECLERALGVTALDPDALLEDLRRVRERAAGLYVTDAELHIHRDEGRP